MVLHEQPQEREPVHARHFHVERDDVGLELLELVARGVGIDRGADDLDVGLGVEGVTHDSAHDG